MSCPYTGSNKTLENICNCKKQIDTLASVIKLYETTLRNNAYERDRYNTDLHNYNRDKTTWDRNRQNKKNELENEEKIWNSCILWTGVYGHDDWCQGDTGFGKQSGAGQHGCLDGQGKGQCKRTTDQVNSALSAWATGKNAQPRAPTQPQLINPTAPSSSIQCCGVSFSDLTSNALSFSDISQKCAGSAGGSDPGAGSTGGAAGSDSGADDNQNYIIAGVIIFIFILMLSAVLLLLVVNN